MKKLIQMSLLAACLTGASEVSAQTEATFYTTMGVIKIELTDALTPRTVDSFIARVSEKFYDGLLFHRVIDNFMIQGGDPLGNGMGGPGYSFPDEFHPTLTNVPKALAMANSGPNTNGSQFFINLVNNTHLNNKHTVFGMVTDGFAVVQAIGKVPVGAGSKPVTDVKMDSIRITKFPANVSNITNGIDAEIYPNPNNGLFTIDLPNAKTTVTIVNMGGQVVYNKEAKRKLKVDLSDLPKGLYIVHMQNVNGTTDSKLVVQ